MVLPSGGELTTELRSAGIEVIVRPLGVLRRGLMKPSGLARITAAAALDSAALGRLVRRRRLALVHSNTSVVLGGAGAAALARVPHVWHVREIYAGFDRAWAGYRRLLASAAALPCVSSATASQFASNVRARVIPDGLAADVKVVARGAARAALELDEGSPTIACIARISDWKGQDVLLRSLATDPMRARRVVGLIAGQPWPGAEGRLAALRRLAVELGVDDRVRFLGFRDDLGTVLGAADLIAVPSVRPDPLPGSAIEAAAAGCTVIASNHGGLPEIIRDRRTGRLFAPGDADALSRVAAELLDDEPKRSRLGQAAAADVRARFAPGQLLSALQSLYDELLGSAA